MLICVPSHSVVAASWLPHQEACVFPWTGRYPQLSSLGCLFTTRTSFWAKVQEIASDAACSPTGWSLACLVCLAGSTDRAGVGSRGEVLSWHAQPASQPASRPSSMPEPGDKQGHGQREREETGKAWPGNQAHNGSGMQRDPAAASPASETEGAGGAVGVQWVTGMWQRAAVHSKLPRGRPIPDLRPNAEPKPPVGRGDCTAFCIAVLLHCVSWVGRCVHCYQMGPQ